MFIINTPVSYRITVTWARAYDDRTAGGVRVVSPKRTRGRVSIAGNEKTATTYSDRAPAARGPVSARAAGRHRKSGKTREGRAEEIRARKENKKQRRADSASGWRVITLVACAFLPEKYHVRTVADLMGGGDVAITPDPPWAFFFT